MEQREGRGNRISKARNNEQGERERRLRGEEGGLKIFEGRQMG